MTRGSRSLTVRSSPMIRMLVRPVRRRGQPNVGPLGAAWSAIQTAAPPITHANASRDPYSDHRTTRNHGGRGGTERGAPAAGGGGDVAITHMIGLFDGVSRRAMRGKIQPDSRGQEDAHAARTLPTAGAVAAAEECRRCTGREQRP